MSNIYPRLLTTLCLLLLTHWVGAADVTIVGLAKREEQNLRSYLVVYQSSGALNIKQSQLNGILDKALNPYGYYHAVAKLDASNSSNVIIEVEPGQQTMLANVDITLSGQARADQDFINIVQDFAPHAGEALDHGRYDEIKSSLQALAQTKGYFDNQFTEARLEVIPSQNAANIMLHFDSGRRYQFGDIHLHGNQIETSRLLDLSTFAKGDDFTVNQLAEYQARLSNTGWFKSAHLTLGDSDENDLIPVDVELVPMSKQVVSVGGGYSSNTGLRGSLNWSQPWYNERGHSFESKLAVSAPEQSLKLGYKIPTHDVLDGYYAVRFEAKHVDYLDTKSLNGNLGFEKHWRLDNDWQSTFYVRYLYEDYQQSLQSNKAQLMMPGVSFSYQPSSQSQHSVKHAHQYALEYSEPYLLSDVRTLRLTGESQMSWNIDAKNKISARLGLGANLGVDVTDLPSSLRFFAGGESSIRGYQYGSISPKDESGGLIGGQYLATLGVDYQTKIYKSLWGGFFYDVGDAYDSAPIWKQGAGVSLEWDSRILPVKLSIARPFHSSIDEWRMHLSLGASF
ncbi:hypothetical protein DA096_19845 [Vibrio rotiferianus]|jgi:translocation and assembly module TamA|uniref:autotransporter assembly complex protein TamA n=1 Tax=Vibrio rotiferianus TaxID=190895 RepID=UPI001110DF0F|nr:autotransporter assembly complex family protein [Vibrio rotiferianus]TMX31709.1 hypothetical protein DA095_22975 [Vibrio rotiferianus]TMX51342.1 hypothetical protein DA093_12190 [Vibrio rotiferianus]TMX60340.1 hypothetical protein DA096_19845 [Vibrio rotiferianus]